MNRPVALITGAARRIGATLAQTFHGAGYDVALHYNNSSNEAKALADQLNQQRENSAALFQAELADTTAVQAMASSVLQWRKHLDVLINNASSFYPTPFEKASEADWDNLVGSNLKGPFFLCQALADSLRKNTGCIINIADIHGRQPLKGHSVYCIAKAGNLMLTKTLANELGPDIRVNGIAPGAIIWPEPAEEHLFDDQLRQRILNQTALGRIGSAEDIANTALFLVEDASYITGHTINVDGGRTLTN